MTTNDDIDMALAWAIVGLLMLNLACRLAAAGWEAQG